MSETKILVQALNKRYRHRGSGDQVNAIDRLDFEIEPGEIVSIVGRTGCGKSTLFNILLGLEAPTNGRVDIGGKTPYGEFREFKGRIGAIFQQDRLLPWRTALGNVELGLDILGEDKQQRREEARHWLVRLGLEDYVDAYPYELSGGMRQRVAMARTFASNPDILLADEAFGHLDEVTADELRQEFLSLTKSQGSTGIFVTHQLDEAIEISDRILVFGRPARLLADISTEELRQAEPGELKSRIQQMLDSNSAERLEA